MPLLNGGLLVNYAKSFKFISLIGRFGGGKTALSYYLAYLLMENHGFRYCLSNCYSMWNDDKYNLQPRIDGKNLYLDAVVILDEAGMFLKVASDVDEFLAYLRKLNVIILAPSVLPPPFRAKFVTCQRVFNAMQVGIPLWSYKLRLSMGDDKYSDLFHWWKPSEMFGIFDSNGYPSSDDGISDVLFYWANEAALLGGYPPLKRRKGFDDEQRNGSTDNFGLSVVESIGRIAEDVNEATEAAVSELRATTVLLPRRGRR